MDIYIYIYLQKRVQLSCKFNWTFCLLYLHLAVIVFFEVLRRVLHHVQVLDQCQGVSSPGKGAVPHQAQHAFDVEKTDQVEYRNGGDSGDERFQNFRGW